jgi:ribosomal-protein-alanine N-acetyltransferase
VTRRLVLRPFELDDAERLTELLQDEEIHRWTGSIPSPYMIDDAIAFLSKREAEEREGSSFVWAITVRGDGSLIGAIGLHDIDDLSARASLGYWIGCDFRGHGFVTEAARRVIAWSFEVGGLHRVQAIYFPGNMNSAAVMRSIGMREEGLLRGYTFKSGEPRDVYMNAILRTDAGWVASEDQVS